MTTLAITLADAAHTERAGRALAPLLAGGMCVELHGDLGAGKTTLFNLICGLIRPDGGRVFFGAQETTRYKPFEIARLGVTAPRAFASTLPRIIDRLRGR